MKELTGRLPMKSPGAPASSDAKSSERFWREIAKGNLTTQLPPFPGRFRGPRRQRIGRPRAARP